MARLALATDGRFPACMVPGRAGRPEPRRHDVPLGEVSLQGSRKHLECSSPVKTRHGAEPRRQRQPRRSRRRTNANARLQASDSAIWVPASQRHTQDMLHADWAASRTLSVRCCYCAHPRAGERIDRRRTAGGCEIGSFLAIPTVRSDGWIRPLRCQSASLGVQQQNLIDGVDFVFRQTNAWAATFSTRWTTLEVSGIGNMTGDRASSHANATCEGVAFFNALPGTKVPASTRSLMTSGMDVSSSEPIVEPSGRSASRSESTELPSVG